MRPIDEALKAVNDNQTELARRVAELTGFPVKQQHVSYWASTAAGYIPGKYCIAVEAISGVSRFRLNPLVFGRPPEAAA